MPTISAIVIASTSSMPFLPATQAPVYSGRPRSRWIASSASSRNMPARSPPSSVLPKPSCGIGFPVSFHEIAAAGTRYATISTQYCATWV